MLDKQRGNLVKADRFGYIKRAMHGTKMLSNREIRCFYYGSFQDSMNLEISVQQSLQSMSQFLIISVSTEISDQLKRNFC